MKVKQKGCGKPLSNSFFPHLVCGEKGDLCSNCESKNHSPCELFKSDSKGKTPEDSITPVVVPSGANSQRDSSSLVSNTEHHGKLGDAGSNPVTADTICSHCGRLLEEDPNKTFLLCNHCNWFIPRGANSYQGRRKKVMKGGNENRMPIKKKSEKTINPDRSLLCDKCKKIKRAGPRRVEKWKGKKYLCRECRPSKRKDKKKNNK